MGLFEKAYRIMKTQGAASLWYIVRQKLKNKESEQRKYAKYIKNERLRRKALAPAGEYTGLFTLLEPGPDIFSELEEAKTPFVAFLEPGDDLAEDWRQQAGAYLAAHPRCRFLYTDEDALAGGRRTEPVFKPDWSPDTYMSYDYVGGLMILEKKLACEAKEQIRSGYRESFLYELGLRAAFLLRPEQIGHLDEVLYHRHRKQELSQELLADLKRQLLGERGIPGGVRWDQAAGCADVVYEPAKKALVSIIVPSKDHVSLLETCIRSVEAGTAYPAVEWIVVDNGSNDHNKREYERLCGQTRFSCRYLYEPMEFNFSKMCNIGAEAAKGAFLLFLNDDMELAADCGTDAGSIATDHGAAQKDQPDWLWRLVGQASLSHVGAVGAKLLYPNSDKIQHLGVVNYTSGAAHLLWQASDGELLPFKRNHTTQNYAVVTGACLLLDAEKFRHAGGFEERLAVTFNDVELCIRLLEAGYYNVVRSDVVFYHHESLSRGQDVLDEQKFLRGLKEREILFDLHPDYIGVDPFYSRHLTQTRLDHTLDYPETWRLSKKVKVDSDASLPEVGADGSEEKILCRILRVTLTEELVIEGWAYRRGRGSEPVKVLLADEEGRLLAFAAEKVYSPTLTVEQATGKNLNFSEFLCRVPKKALKAGTYQLGVEIAGVRRTMRRITI